jgi:RNA polymerase sigma factor (sigma-70 family)
MPDESDMDLVREYARHNSEPAFAELVQRHIALVYSVALRFTRNPPDAEDMVQAVFVILARKAAELVAGTILTGWLYETTRLTALQWLRNQGRRRHHEQEAHMQSTLDNPNADAVWRQVEPLLEQAMSRLNRKDRTLLALRFYENRTGAETAAILGIGEWAARKRAERALEKLRSYFSERGVNSTTKAIAETISANSIQTAPAVLAKTVTAVVLAKGAVASTSTLTLIKGALKIMAWTKARTAIVAGVAALLAVGTATIGIVEMGGGNNSTDAQVLEIVRTNAGNSGRGADLIAKIGPKALPALEKLVRWKKSRWSFFDAVENQTTRDSAVAIVSQLGPAAVRPLTSALCSALKDPNLTDGNTLNPAYGALLEWSVPGSSEAVAVLTNALADPSRGSSLPGDFANDDPAYSNLPDVVPRLIPSLKNPRVIYSVSHILASMGTNAASAIPALISACNNGYDVNPPALKLKALLGYIPRGKKNLVWSWRTVTPAMSKDEKMRNRCWALDAVGRIGIASPDVVTALQQALTDADDKVRFAALKSLYALQQRPQEPLADVLNGFPPCRGTDFGDIVNWVGHLGGAGRAALPWLRQLTDFNYVQSLPQGTNAPVGWNLAISTETLRESAIVAICEIDPSQIKPAQVNGAELLHGFEANWEATKRARSETNAAALLAILTPQLNSTNPADASLAAYIVLGIVPGNSQALQTLRRCTAEGSLDDRLIAAEWLWDETGDSTNLLKLAIAGLKSADGEELASQLAPQLLARLGDQARPAIPALKAALWRQGTFSRSAAGNALRKIAPEELPPIH